ncbi:MAG: cupin domain-containing protein [Pseudomonadota bacterium]
MNDAPLKVTRSGEQPPIQGQADYFTGAVEIETPFRADGPGRVSGGHISFTPGARTVWHSHPFGQTLVVTRGAGWVQRWGGPVQRIRPGDVVWIPADEKHWHGATATEGMSHVAITEHQDGKTADWFEPVSQAQYSGPDA